MIKLKRDTYLSNIDGLDPNIKVLAVIGECDVPFDILGSEVKNDTVFYKVSYRNSITSGKMSNIYGNLSDRKMTLATLLDKYIIVYSGWITSKFMCSNNPLDDLENNDRYTVYIPGGLIKKLSNHIENVNDKIKEAIRVKINEKRTFKPSVTTRKNEFLKRASLYSYFNTLRPHDLSVVNRVFESGNLIDLLLLDFNESSYSAYLEAYKRLMNSLIHLMRNLRDYPTEYLLHGIENLKYRYGSQIPFGLGFALAINSLEKFIIDKDIQYYDHHDKWNNTFDTKVNFMDYLRKEIAKTNEDEYSFDAPFGENSLLGGQSLGIMTTPLLRIPTVVREEILMDIKQDNGTNSDKNPDIVNTINSVDDNTRIFMYKDLALSLEDIKSRIDDIDSEETRAVLNKELTSVKQRMLEYKVRLAGSGIISSEFDNLDKQIEDIGFEINNFNIFSPENVAMSESLGIPVYGFGERFAFGEINPYNMDNESGGKFKAKAKEVAGQGVVKVENFVVKNLRLVGNAILYVGDFLMGSFVEVLKSGFKMSRKLYDSLNVLMGAGFGEPIHPLGRSIEKGINKTRNNIRKIQKNRNKGAGLRRKFTEKVEAALESYPTIEESMEYVPIKMKISYGEGSLFDAIRNGRQKVNRKIALFTLSKFVAKMNKVIADGKVTDPGTLSTLTEYNEITSKKINELAKKKEISPKEKEWMSKNLIYNLGSGPKK